MRILSLEIENYGVFGRRRLDFGDGRLVLVYGPNEAGKSTLLQLLRETMFGFPHRNSLPTAGGPPQATAIIELRNGRRLKWSRRKGRRETVSGQYLDGAEESLDEAGCLSLLQGAGAELFRHVFAFSLHELQAGEKSLAEARLTDALYGGGLGGLAEFQLMQKQLIERQKELFSQRGTKPVINRLIRDIREAQDKLRTAAVKPGQFALWDQQSREAEQYCERLRRELEQARQRRTWLDHHVRSIPRRRRLAELSQELATCALEPDLLQRDLTEVAGNLRRLRELNEQLQRTDADRARQLQRRSELSRADAALLAAQQHIESHYQDLKRIASFRNDMPLRLQEAATCEQEIARRLEKWRPDWGMTFLADYPFGQAELQVLRSRVTEREKLAREQTAATTLLEELQSRLAENEQKLAADAAPFPQDLAELVQQQGATYESWLEESRRCRQDLSAITAALQQLAQKSQDMLQQQVQLAGEEMIPNRSSIEAMRSALDASDKQQDAVQQQRAALQQQLKKCRKQLASLVQQGVPSSSDLVAARAERDRQWQALCARLAHVVSPSALKDYERAVAACDELGDRILAQADQVVRRDQLLENESSLQNQLQQTEAEAEQCRGQRQQLDERWRAMWQALKIEPLSPAAMLDWRRLAEEMLQLRTRRDQLQRQLEEVGRRCAGMEQQLSDAGAEIVEGQTLLLARARIAEARQQQALRQQLSQQLTAWTKQAAECQRRCAELATRQAAWESAWSKTLEDLHLPGHWEPALAQEVLSELLELKSRWRDAQTLRRRASDMLTEVQQFEANVAQLAQSIAPDLAGLPTEQMVVRLHERLVEDQAVARVDREISNLLAQLEQQKSELTKQCEQLSSALQAASIPAAAISGDQSEQWWQRIARAAEIQQEMRRLQEMLAELNAPAPHDWQLDASQLEDAAACSAELSAWQQQVEQLEREYRDALKRSGSLREKLDELAQQHDAAGEALQLERARAELVSAVDQWAPVVLAGALMQRCLANFEESLQPQILQQVTHLFQRLTSGRYISIRRQLDEQGKLRVEQCDGTWKEPAELSTGTREQLYLAIRLAYVLQYCRDCEPLPLVLDDVLVNFDERRVANTFDVLREVSASVPLMLMTCHAPTARAVLRDAPDVCHVDLAEPLDREIPPASVSTGKRKARAPGGGTAESQATLFPPGS